MHREIYRSYEQLFDRIDFDGPILEVGAMPSHKSLLCLPRLAKQERVGLNLDGPHTFDGFEIVKGSACDMPFEDNRFGLVVCNAVIEHVPDFWNVLSEIKRVARPGGLIVIGAPGYRQFRGVEWVQGYGRRFLPWLNNNRYMNALFTATTTFQIHNEPGDYYRFSDQAFREVVMGGLERVDVTSIMWPPRLMGVGWKPNGRQKK